MAFLDMEKVYGICNHCNEEIIEGELIYVSCDNDELHAECMEEFAVLNYFSKTIATTKTYEEDF
jgi:hypothetical protein